MLSRTLYNGGEKLKHGKIGSGLVGGALFKAVGAIGDVVNDKIDTAQRNDIEFIYNCEDTALSFIDDIDLTIILSNLLDNAFEECMNNKAEHNTINLCICQINNFNIINLTNTC